MVDIVTLNLHVPELEELAEVLQNGLENNFAEVQVSVVDCPNMTNYPFLFPVPGICGNPRIADVGGIRHLVPVPRIDIVYDINSIAQAIKLPGAYMLGAGAVSFRTTGINGELMHSVKAESENTPAVNGSYMARVNPVNGEYVLEKYSAKYKDCDFGLMSNLFACDGLPGEVIEVKVNKRIGDDNFVSCMKKSLERYYKEEIVGIGGSFLIQQGKAKVHVMPTEFPSVFESDADVVKWLKFYEMKAPLICQTVFISHDPGLDLRLEHTHCFSHHGEGGHYHDDTTPDTVEYLGYFNAAELLFRIDQPKMTA